MKYIPVTLRRRRKRSNQHQEQEEQSPTTTLMVSVDNEETKFPFRFTPGTLSWKMFIDDLKSLCEVSQQQRVSLTYEQNFGENCFKSHLKERIYKPVKENVRSHSNEEPFLVNVSTGIKEHQSWHPSVQHGSEASPAEKSAVSPECDSIKCSQTSKSCKETSEMKGPFKQTAENVLY